MMWWWGDTFMFGGWWMMAALGVVFIVIIAATIALVGYAVSQGRRDTGHQSRGEATPTSSAPETSARAMLDARYARGEIDTDEYLERATHLSS